MQRNTTSSGASHAAGLESRQVIAILGILLTGTGAALMLPHWTAASLMLLALISIRLIARFEPVMEPIVIRRDEHR